MNQEFEYIPDGDDEEGSLERYNEGVEDFLSYCKLLRTIP